MASEYRKRSKHFHFLLFCLCWCSRWCSAPISATFLAIVVVYLPTMHCCKRWLRIGNAFFGNSIQGHSLLVNKTQQRRGRERRFVRNTNVNTSKGKKEESGNAYFSCGIQMPFFVRNNCSEVVVKVGGEQQQNLS